MQKPKKIELVYLGCEMPDYFQGFSTGSADESVVGSGYTMLDAIEDALGQASDSWDLDLYEAQTELNNLGMKNETITSVAVIDLKEQRVVEVRTESLDESTSAYLDYNKNLIKKGHVLSFYHFSSGNELLDDLEAVVDEDKVSKELKKDILEIDLTEYPQYYFGLRLYSKSEDSLDEIPLANR